MRESIQYALDNHDEALQYALQFARDMEPRLAEKFVGMYVNHYTLDAGEVVPKAVQKLLDMGFEAGLISKRVEVEFVRYVPPRVRLRVGSSLCDLVVSRSAAPRFSPCWLTSLAARPRRTLGRRTIWNSAMAGSPIRRSWDAPSISRTELRAPATRGRWKYESPGVPSNTHP
jgi:hypothetical protein